jgi:hypothetical protein
MTDAQSLIITQATNAGSSSAEAYALAFPTNRNRTNTGSLYIKSSATVQKTYSTNSYAVLNPSGLKHDYTTPIMVDSDYVFTNDLDTVYGTDSAVSIVNNFINETSSSFASALLSLIPNYKITGSFANDAEAAICLVPTGSLYRTAAGVLRVKIS